MLRRSKKAPTLYELIRERPAGGSFNPGAGATSRYPSPHVPPVAAEPDPHAGANSLLSPGRVVRLPVGYLFFAGAIVLALIVGGYAVGYKKRDAEAAADRQREAQRALSGVTDPLQTDPVRSADPPPSRTAATPERQVPVAPVRGGPGARILRVDSPAADPRQAGLNYLVIAFLPEKEAERAAEFLAGQGLEIGLVKADNRPSWREVVDLQGLEASQLGGEASDRIRQRVTALGREYKRQERGPVDFADAYWKKHQTR